MKTPGTAPIQHDAAGAAAVDRDRGFLNRRSVVQLYPGAPEITREAVASPARRCPAVSHAPVDTKRCNRCQRDLPLDAFARDRTRRDGLQNRCRDCQAKAAARYLEAHGERVRARVQSWRATHRDRRHAHQAVERAVRSGRLHREPCACCGDEKAEAHHDDYTKPLDVVWLCRTHHRARHRDLDAAHEASALAGGTA